MRDMNRKGFFFTVDAIIGLLVMAVGFAVIFAPAPAQPEQEPILDYATKTLSLLTAREVREFADYNITQLWCEDCEGATHEVAYPDNSVLEQVVEFSLAGNAARAEFLWNKSIGGLIPSSFSHNLTVEDQGVVTVAAVRALVPADRSSVRIASSRIIFLRTPGGLRGPYIARLDLWR
jgi:hypothetical protein